MPAIPSESESELSPVEEALNHANGPNANSNQSSPKHEYRSDHESVLSDADEDADMVSDDADFEVGSPPKPAITLSRESPSTSESPRPPKRKSGIEEAEIEANPELYGIRRSHRARNVRRFIESESNADSDSDIAVNPRKRRRQTSNRGE
jgi:chromodomain-helicase-DNA-binding protein 1